MMETLASLGGRRFLLWNHCTSASGMATKRHSSSADVPTSALFVCGRCANVGGMPSTMSAKEDSRERLLLLEGRVRTADMNL